ncbi:hypothetical protein ACIRBX_32505 [Kitasatospora sp. NPDC096147]|uniref:hypothetical protein n=1 Tax=Kitasatospora sp. NPDC096147 TaxID=3364093 RepID=UPI00380F6E94
MTAEPSAAPSAALLRAALLAVAAALAGDRQPVLVREWADALELHGEPVGYRYLALVGVERGPAESGFDRVTEALTEARWTAHRWSGPTGGTGWATAKRAGLELTAHQGRGVGVLTLGGHTPVVFVPGREGLRQPLYTLSTGPGVLCPDCQGWGICLICEGTGRSHSPGSFGYGRCQCWAGQAGPGRCVDCAGQGRITSYSPPWTRRGHGLPDSAVARSAPRPEPTPATALDALADVAHRPCACGDLRCHWQLARTRTELRITGPCQACARPRSYAFAPPPAR